MPTLHLLVLSWVVMLSCPEQPPCPDQPCRPGKAYLPMMESVSAAPPEAVRLLHFTLLSMSISGPLADVHHLQCKLKLPGPSQPVCAPAAALKLP